MSDSRTGMKNSGSLRIVFGDCSTYWRVLAFLYEALTEMSRHESASSQAPGVDTIRRLLVKLRKGRERA